MDVRFVGTLAFPDEVLAHFDCALDLPNRSELEVVGSEGTAHLARPWVGGEPLIELVRGGQTESIIVEDGDRYRLQLENMSAAIRGEGVPLLGRADALGQARTLEALSLSAAAGGRPAPVDPEPSEPRG